MPSDLAYLVDTNFIITLAEIGELSSLLKLQRIIVPNIILPELKTYDTRSRSPLINVSGNFTAIAKSNECFNFVDVTDEQKSALLEEISNALVGSNLKFLIELEQQLRSVTVPANWYQIPSVILNAGMRLKILQGCVSSTQLGDISFYRKNEDAIALEHADIQVCALQFSLKSSYVISMDSHIWRTLLHIDQNFRTKIVTIFLYLGKIYEDNPESFIDALTKTIEIRYKFADEITGSFSSMICYIDLEKALENVLARYVLDEIEEKRWTDSRTCARLLNLLTRIRQLLASNSPTNIYFDKEYFLKELQFVKQEFISLKGTKGLSKS